MASIRREPARLPRSRPGAAAADLEFRQLKAFVALVDEGSMTAVAKALGVAQSTVSEALASLERNLGTSVAARRSGAHRLALTPAGRALLPHARAVLAGVAEARRAVASVARETRGRLEIVANESVSTYVLAEALDRMRAGWPNTRFAVTVGTCPAVREGIASGRFDVGLLLETAERAEPDRAGRAALAAVELLLFCGAEHPLASAGPPARVPRDRLAAYPVFVSDASGDFQTLLDGYFRPDGLPGPRLESTGSIEGVKRSVLGSARALGVLPGYALREELRSGRARRVAVEPAVPRVRLTALYPASRALHPAVSELVEGLRVGSGSRATA